jgi:hypothetical protein
VIATGADGCAAGILVPALLALFGDVGGRRFFGGIEQQVIESGVFGSGGAQLRAEVRVRHTQPFRGIVPEDEVCDLEGAGFGRHPWMDAAPLERQLVTGLARGLAELTILRGFGDVVEHREEVAAVGFVVRFVARKVAQKGERAHHGGIAFFTGVARARP